MRVKTWRLKISLNIKIVWLKDILSKHSLLSWLMSKLGGIRVPLPVVYLHKGGRVVIYPTLSTNQRAPGYLASLWLVGLRRKRCSGGGSIDHKWTMEPSNRSWSQYRIRLLKRECSWQIKMDEGWIRTQQS